MPKIRTTPWLRIALPAAPNLKGGPPFTWECLPPCVGRFSPLLILSTLPLSGGCSLLLPEISNQPVIRNPFPQLSKIAVAPFFNQSDEPTVDGREFAMAYFAELQKTPGFEVVPVGVVEEAIINHRVDLSGPGEARRLAKLLGVDAVVVGAVTDYSPYYPPRCGIAGGLVHGQSWLSRNPGGLWASLEHAGRRIHSRFARLRSEVLTGPAQMADLAPDCDQSRPTLATTTTGAGTCSHLLSKNRVLPTKANLRLVQAMEDLPSGLQFTPEDVQSATNGNNPSMVMRRYDRHNQYNAPWLSRW